MKTETPIWTVRNASGQFLATYRAKSAAQAIDHLINDQMAIASHFHRHSVPKREELSAKIETPLRNPPKDR